MKLRHRTLAVLVVAVGASAAQGVRRDAPGLALDLLLRAGMPDVALRVLATSGTSDAADAAAVEALVEARREAATGGAPAAFEKALLRLAARLEAPSRPSAAVASVLDVEIADLWRRCAVAFGDEAASRRRCADAARRAWDAVVASIGGAAPRDPRTRPLWARAVHQAAESRLLAAPPVQAPDAPDPRREARDLFDGLALEAESDASLSGWLPWALEGSLRASRALGDMKGARESYSDFLAALARVDRADPAYAALVEAGRRASAFFGESFDPPPPTPAARSERPEPPPSPRSSAAALLREGRRLDAAAVLESAAESATPSEAFEARAAALGWRVEHARSVAGVERAVAARDVARRTASLVESEAFRPGGPAPTAVGWGLRRTAAATLLGAVGSGGADAELLAEAAALLRGAVDAASEDPDGWFETRVLRARIRLRSGALDSAAAEIDGLLGLAGDRASVAALVREQAEALERRAVDGASKAPAARAWKRWLEVSGAAAGPDVFDAVGWKLREAGLYEDAVLVDEAALGRFPAPESRRGRWRLRAAEARELCARTEVREGKDPSSSFRAARAHLGALRSEAGGTTLAARRDARALEARLEGGQAVEASGTWTWIAGAGDAARASTLWVALRDEGTEPWVWEARFHLVVLSALNDRSAGRDPAAARAALATLEALHPSLGGPAVAARFRWAERAFLR